MGYLVRLFINIEKKGYKNIIDNKHISIVLFLKLFIVYNNIFSNVLIRSSSVIKVKYLPLSLFLIFSILKLL